MAKFQIEHNGKKYQVDAPDEQTALDAFADAMGIAPATESAPAPAPAPAVPSAMPPMKRAFAGAIGAETAFADQAIDAIPVIGPAIKGGLEEARSYIGSLFGMGTPEEVKRKLAGFTTESIAAEPGAAAAGKLVGQVSPAALTMTPLGAFLMGSAGGLPAQMTMGGLSAAGIMGADALVRGKSAEEAAGDALIGGTAGILLPGAGKLVGMGADAILGTGASKEAAHLARALGDDGVAPDQIAAKLQELGPDAMLMDLGPNLQAQAGALASLPGQAQKTVRAAVGGRAATAGERVAADVAATVGRSPDIDALKQTIIAEQSAAAKPLYDSVRGVEIPLSGNIAFVFQTPMGKQALAEARAMAANDGVVIPDGKMTVGLLDYAKRALDDIASAASRAEGKGNKARQASGLAALLRNEADKLVPDYKFAREAFAGPAQVLDAIDLGASVFTKDMSPMQLQATMNSMGTGEKDALLQSVRSSIEALMGNAVNDVAALRNLLRRGWNEQKLRILLGNDVADDLMKRIDRELVFGETTNAVSRNSETARRAASQAEVAPTTPAMRPDGFIGLLFRAIDAARAGLRGKVQPKINARLAAALSSGQIEPQLLRQISRASQPKGYGGFPAAAGAGFLTEQ